jgi:tRNA A-37 threonylcarbamoyl transferase component Bud32
MDGIVGSTIRGIYLIEAEIGRGGMGEVYRARHLKTGQLVAIKIMSPKATSAHDSEHAKRFQNEAKAVSSIDHPNIVKLYEVGTERIGGQDRDFMIMELVQGETLAARIQGHPMAVPEALDFAIQIVAALAAAHAATIVHRDVKPSNVLVTPDGVIKLADFGLAKFAGPPADPFAETGSVQLELTHSGTIIGSMAYMSPEQARGLAVDMRSDIFSFGSVFYEMLCGKPAFTGSTSADRLSAVLSSDPEDIPFIPIELNSILMRCMRKDANRRWQSAAELLTALDDFRKSGTSAAVQSTRRAWIYGAVGLAAGLLPAAYLATRKPVAQSFQRLTFRSGDISGAFFAPNGLVAYTAAWDGAAPALFTCIPGNREPRRVDVPSGRIFGITQANEVALVLTKDSTLTTVSLGGGEPRPRLENVVEAHWAPDGNAMGVIRAMGPGQFQVDYPIGTKRYETTGRPPQSIHISPDGKDVAFFDFDQAGGDYKIILVAGNEKPRVLTTGLRAFGSLLWHPSGKEIWFTATRAKLDPMLYATNLAGAERIVGQTPEWLILHDIDRTNRMLVAQTQSRLTVRIGGPAAPREASLSWLDSSVIFDITADDRQFIFAELGYSEGRNPSIYVRNIDGSPARKLGEGNRPILTPDGRKLVCIRNTAAESRLAIIPTGPGIESVLPLDGWSFNQAGWLPDNSRLLAFGNRGSTPPATFLIDANGALGRQVAPVRAIRSSPDGKLAAGIEKGSLNAYAIDADAPARTITAAKPGEAVIRWTEAGIYTNYTDGPGSRTIDVIDPTSGRRTKAFELALPEPGAAIYDPVLVSPSGRLYAFTYQRDLASLHLATGFA